MEQSLDPLLTITTATEPDDLSAVSRLMRMFVDWHYERHTDFRELVDRYFDPTIFESELATLPGRYAQPTGCLLIAKVDGEVAGCGGFRDLGTGVCEMKRLFVLPQFHGHGIGMALGNRLINEAWNAGYLTMRLETGRLQYEAHRLYERLGFTKILPYHELDAEMQEFFDLHGTPNLPISEAKLGTIT